MSDYIIREVKISKVNQNIRIKLYNKSKMAVNLTIVTLLFLTIYGFFTFEYKDLNIVEAITSTIGNMKTMFMAPKLVHFSWQEGIYQLVITIGLSFLTTVFGATLSFFLGIFAARNLSSNTVSLTIKGFVAFVRAVPTILWVLIFAVTAGLGSVAAVVGLSFHTLGYLIKAYSESFEEIDEGVIEALKASGASYWQIIFQAVLPETMNYLIAWTFIRFEINFLNAVAIGAAAGAGGIGFDLHMASNFYFNLNEIGIITYMVLVVALVLEAGANYLKNNVLY